FAGLLAFEDPARPEVRPAIEYCGKNGIKVLMITGDHPQTAAAIAKDVGLGGGEPRVISAESEPEKFEATWLGEHPDFLRNADVVARCNPMQKLRVVEALKSFGDVVAVTGDGVNDVPALKAADIGIAMGVRGARSAKFPPFFSATTTSARS
ncbi:MAG TPA: HAD-IC family P-type ATPase, partial [Pseudobdellovibrionaceae bacterium]|nr:HAD-IC family P-type ATPase [Pseudobdellovibrionaceae bacterium]